MKLLQLFSHALIGARCLLVLAASASLCWLAAAGLLDLLAEDERSFEQVLVMTCAVALLGCTGWMLVATLSVLVAEIAHSAPRLPVPSAHRALVLSLCGLAVSAPLMSGAAHADQSRDPRPDRGRDVVSGLPFPDRPSESRAMGKVEIQPPGHEAPHRVDLLPVPARAPQGVTPTPEPGPPPTAPPPAAPPPSPTTTAPAPAQPAPAEPAPAQPAPAEPAPAERHADSGRVVTVQSGDSLWSITRDLLSPDATDDQITEGWQQIHHLNRAVIGDDPGLIHPGQRLRVPLDLPHLVQEQP